MLHSSDTIQILQNPKLSMTGGNQTQNVNWLSPAVSPRISLQIFWLSGPITHLLGGHPTTNGGGSAIGSIKKNLQNVYNCSNIAQKLGAPLARQLSGLTA